MNILEDHVNIMYYKRINIKKDNIDTVCKQIVEASFFSKINICDMLN